MRKARTIQADSKPKDDPRVLWAVGCAVALGIALEALDEAQAQRVRDLLGLVVEGRSIDEEGAPWMTN